MNGIHIGRVVLGGLVAGIVVNIGEGVLNAVLLADRWEEARAALGLGVEGTVSMALYAVWSFLIGMVLVAVYAGIRPRFGPGPRTALVAGALVWTAASLGGAVIFTAAELYPADLVWSVAAGEALVFAGAALAGAWLYREKPSTA